MQIFLSSSESKLRVKDGMFEVSFFDKEGRPQKMQHAPSLVESIWMNEGASVTVAALRLAMNSRVDVVICDRHGEPEGRVLSFKPTTTSLVQKAQAMASISPQGMEYARGWTMRKLAAQAAYLERLGKRRPAETRAALDAHIAQINDAANKMCALAISEPHAPTPLSVAASLRGLEGIASKAFFQALAEIIPPEYRFEGRSRRPSKDAFNAFLNYAFAVLYRKVERALIKAGFHSYIGFLHRDGYQFKSLVFDFIEPYRVDMVQAVFTLFTKQRVKTIHTETQQDGGVRLTKEGKDLLMQKINKFYLKKVAEGGTNMVRDHKIERDAQHFAQSLLPNKSLDRLADEMEAEAAAELFN